MKTNLFLIGMSLIAAILLFFSTLIIICGPPCPMERLKQEDPARYEYEQKVNDIYSDLMKKIDEVIAVYHDPVVLYKDAGALTEARGIIQKYRAEAAAQRQQAWKEYKEKSLSSSD